ncbi:integral membrane protein [Cryptococcus wingfieldii CBS 7118]|uniref:Integral membrane protein n=1 Tax=Cryptococcus wingfieldii CBS 7118 TaxID=1295528 RepID=A0A1E3J184_9TREE|nr:integral membrane protein [Cryptococcus wingfieldii CBS 7118]ODN94650.1 integral membrane protein [Cryptococcus wingfieldii CBS 7118]
MRISSIVHFITALLTFAPLRALAADTLYTDAVTYCAEAKAVIVDEFGITYHRSNQSVTFSFSLASVESNLNVSANLYVNAFGIEVVNQTLEICDLLSGVACPLPQVNFSGYGTYPIPSRYTQDIPSIGFSVPNLEAYARVELLRVENGEVAACLQATLANGKTTKQRAVVWATAIFTLVAFLVALAHTASATSPSPIQYRWFDILFIFQTAAATGLLHLNYSLSYSAFVQNFSWALGLFHSSNMQSSINKMRAKTGGTMDSEAYSDVQYINRKFSPYNVYANVNDIGSSTESFNTFVAANSISKRDLEAHHLSKRVQIASALAQNATTDLNTGLPVYTNTINIPEANAYSTVWFAFLALIAIFIAFHAVLFGFVILFEKMGHGRKGMYWAPRLRKMWWPFCIGNALRLCMIAFFPIFIFAFWQFHIGDSGLAIFFAVFGILLCFLPLLAAFLLTLRRSRTTSQLNPQVNPIYVSYRYFHSLGVLYRQYRAKYNWFWFAPFVLAMIARAGFIAFGPANAWAQVIGNIVVEAIVFVAMMITRPHKDKKGDWLGGFLSMCRMISFGLLVAFIPSVGVRPIPRAVIGFVIIVFTGIPVVILFFGFLWNIGYGYLWRKDTTRIEDGLEVERFSPTSSNSSVPAPIMKEMDAHDFVSSDAAARSRASLNGYGAGVGAGAGLAGAGRRATDHSGSGSGSSSSELHTPIDPPYPGHNYRPSSYPSGKQYTSEPYSPTSPVSQYHSPTSPTSASAADAYAQAANGSYPRSSGGYGQVDTESPSYRYSRDADGYDDEERAWAEARRYQ